MKRAFWRMAFFDVCFLAIILPQLLWSTCLDEKLSAKIRIVGLIEIDLYLFFWLWVRDKWWQNFLRCEHVPQEELVNQFAV